MGLSRFELPIELRSSVAYLLGFSIQMCLSRLELPIELGSDLLEAPGAPVGPSI